MRPTRRVNQRRSSANPVVGGYGSRQGLVAAKGVGLDNAAKAGQMITRPLTAAIGTKAVIGGGGPLALPRPLIDDISPQPPGPGLAVARRQHRYWRVVGVNDWRRQDMDADQLGQRRHPPGGMPDPVGQGGALDLDALARQDRRLAVERQPVEIFVDHDIGDEARPRPPLLDRQIGHRRLHNALAAAAAELGPNMADHFEAGRDLLQDLGHVRAEFAKPGAAAARADRPRIMHDLLARQMIGQWPPHRLAPFARWLIRGTLCRRRGACRFALLQILEHQLELRDLSVEFFR